MTSKVWNIRPISMNASEKMKGIFENIEEKIQEAIDETVEEAVKDYVENGGFYLLGNGRICFYVADPLDQYAKVTDFLDMLHWITDGDDEEIIGWENVFKTALETLRKSRGHK